MEKEVNHSIDTRRVARQQERVLAETSSIALTITRPIFQQQRAMFHLAVDVADAWITNWERSLEFITSMAQESQRQLTKHDQPEH